MAPDAVHPRIWQELAAEQAPCYYSLLLYITQIWKCFQRLDTGKHKFSLKENDEFLPSNFRHVSLTCILCKVMKHIVCSNIMQHVDTHGIFKDFLHVFYKKRSCATQLCAAIDDWAEHLYNGQQTDIFIMDFKKAFETVPHKLLKYKLKQLWSIRICTELDRCIFI